MELWIPPSSSTDIGRLLSPAVVWRHIGKVGTPQPWRLPGQPSRGTDLAALGISNRVLCVAVSSGRLIRLRRDVYLDARAWPDDLPERHRLRAAAEQVAHPDGAVSHRSAALHWGLALPDEDWAEEPAWLTLPAEAGYRSRSLPGVEHCVGNLPAHHVTAGLAGVRVTTLARTAVDVARDLPLPEALQVLDASLRLLCLDLLPNPRRRDLGNERLVQAASRGLHEAAGLLPRMAGVRRALEYASPLRESPIESLSFGHLVLAGFPIPVCQPAIQTPVGVFFPDFYWEAQNLIGESDGRRKYTDPAAIVREKEREQALRDLGFRIVRWLGKEIHLNPDAVLGRIGRALAL